MGGPRQKRGGRRADRSAEDRSPRLSAGRTAPAAGVARAPARPASGRRWLLGPRGGRGGLRAGRRLLFGSRRGSGSLCLSLARCLHSRLAGGFLGSQARGFICCSSGLLVELRLSSGGRGAVPGSRRLQPVLRHLHLVAEAKTSADPTGDGTTSRRSSRRPPQVRRGTGGSRAASRVNSEHPGASHVGPVLLYSLKVRLLPADPAELLFNVLHRRPGCRRLP
jgi:hypothetical protein